MTKLLLEDFKLDHYYTLMVNGYESLNIRVTGLTAGVGFSFYVFNGDWKGFYNVLTEEKTVYHKENPVYPTPNTWIKTKKPAKSKPAWDSDMDDDIAF